MFALAAVLQHWHVDQLLLAATRPVPPTTLATPKRCHVMLVQEALGLDTSMCQCQLSNRPTSGAHAEVVETCLNEHQKHFVISHACQLKPAMDQPLTEDRCETVQSRAWRRP